MKLALRTRKPLVKASAYVPVKRMVSRKGKTFMQTFWVTSSDAKRMREEDETSQAVDADGQTTKVSKSIGSHGEGFKGKKKLILLKSKYIKRWKGKDGKWNYKYPRDKKTRKKGTEEYKVETAFTEQSSHIMKMTGNKSEMSVTIAADGSVLLAKHGDHNSVQYTKKELAKQNGCRLHIHNHPSNRSFSGSDISLGISNKFKEMRVITETGWLYSFKPDPKNTGTDHIDSMSIFLAVESIMNKHFNDLAPTFLKRVSSGELTKDEGDMEFQHELVNRVVKELHGTYKRIKVKEK